MKLRAFFLISALCLPIFTAAADDTTYNPLAQPPTEGADGTVVYHIGGNSLVVPKDARVKVEGALITVENPEQYVARTLNAFEKRIDSLQQRIVTLENRVNATTVDNRRTLATP